MYTRGSPRQLLYVMVPTLETVTVTLSTQGHTVVDVVVVGQEAQSPIGVTTKRPNGITAGVLYEHT